MMRQGRTSFPADVLKQHEDGSLDLYVIMEPEEIIMEQRVSFQSHDQPHHCWAAVRDAPEGNGLPESDIAQFLDTSRRA